MIPRIHSRGSSFRGACDYILHDAQRQSTTNRVPWCMTVNLSTKDPKWAWHEMVDTYWGQDALKAAAGVDLRGRKNKKPVYHYSLSWAESENPSQEDMQKAALSSLKALGLEDHQALIAQHTDTKNMHVHIVVNLINPTNGRSIDLKFPKLDLSRWAEAYEKEHGIQVEQRIRNNEARRLTPDHVLFDQFKVSGKAPNLTGPEKEAQEREKQRIASEKYLKWKRRQAMRMAGPDKLLGLDPDAELSADVPKKLGWYRRNRVLFAGQALGTRSKGVADGVPKARKKISIEERRKRDPLRKQRNPMHNLANRREDFEELPIVQKQSNNRRLWVEQRDILDRMKRMRAEAEVFHKIERNHKWQEHKKEREDLWNDSRDALRQAREHFNTKFRPLWRDIYKTQREEMGFIEKASPLERAVFVLKHEYRLGNGRPLKALAKQAAIARPGKLLDLLEMAHERERTRLAQVQKAEASTLFTKIMDTYAKRQDALFSRQTDERMDQKLEQYIESRKVTFQDARLSLIEEGAGQPPAERKFKQAEDLSEAFGNEAGGDASEGQQQPYDRAEEIRKDMEAWRKKNRGKDFGREM